VMEAGLESMRNWLGGLGAGAGRLDRIVSTAHEQTSAIYGSHHAPRLLAT
jgi:hypothetical protein